MIWAPHLKLFVKVSVAAFALGALATSGKAQNTYQGKFTLAVETHRAGAVLPAGDYTFTLPSNSAPYRFYIQGQGTSAIIQANTAEVRVVSKRPQLNIVDITDVHTVQTFEGPELGVTFTYWTPTQKHAEHKEADQKTVPQTALASQASENRISVEVRTTGR
jgi:hypothetical protein